MRFLLLFFFITSTPLFALDHSDIDQINASNCVALVDHLNQKLLTEKPVGEVHISAIEEKIKDVFSIRMRLREKYKFLVRNRLLNDADHFLLCGQSIRNFMTALREREDLWSAQWLYDQKKKVENYELPKTASIKMQGSAPFTLFSQKYHDFQFPQDLQSGDLILTRGTDFISSVVGKIGALDNQFSHVAIYYRDSQEKSWIIEALFPGVRVISFDEYYKDKKGRMAVFRYSPSVKQGLSGGKLVAKLAAESIYQWANQASLENRVIPYDFKMDPIDHETVFCSELVGMAYDMACSLEGIRCEKYPEYIPRPRPHFPLMYTPFYTERNGVLQALGIQVVETFSPADIETDPSLDLVGEWRSFEDMEQILLQDAVLAKIMDWMENYGYVFQLMDEENFLKPVDLGQDFATQMGQVPAEMPAGYTHASVLLFFLMEYDGTSLNWSFIREQAGIGNDLFQRMSRHNSFIKHIRKAQDRYLQIPRKASAKTGGFYLTSEQIGRGMDILRLKDCERFRKNKNGASEVILFHDIINTNGLCPLEGE